MNDRQMLLSKLPKIDALLKSDEAIHHIPLLGRDAVVHICRNAVEQAKQRALKQGIEPMLNQVTADIAKQCKSARSRILGPVINGTGVLLHTNLGRAPLGSNLFTEIGNTVGGYSNLEIDVLDRKRGIRGPHVSSLLAQVCDTEDAVVVNNNAAALFLILREFAPGKEVIVSRGELVQIGGGFRIPDILSSSGAVLSEVGTTNITTLADFEAAVTPNTGLVLKVHQSNFRMDGFVKAPDIRELANGALGDATLVSDLGSGNVVRRTDGLALGEPTPADMIKQGADLVCFSCDKMLGGVQGGVIAGKANLIARLKKNPVMRVVRVDKITYAALQVVLTHHLNGDHDKVKLWSMVLADKNAVEKRVKGFISEYGLSKDNFSTVDTNATFGGGSTPGGEIPSAALKINADRKPDEIARFFQEWEPPIVGTVNQGDFQLDFRTILQEDEPTLAEACKALLD